MFDEVVKISSGLARMLHPKFYQKSTFWKFKTSWGGWTKLKTKKSQMFGS
jgi:hypothetical protein